MKKRLLKQVSACLLAVVLLFSALPATAGAQSGPVEKKHAPHIDFNPEFVEWTDHEGKGPMPAPVDLSYLRESYARQCGGVSLFALTDTKFDLRQQGTVDLVEDQWTGYCWALASNSAAASRLLPQFPHLKLSPIHTAYAAYAVPGTELIAPGANFSDPEKILNNGGFSSMAVATMARWDGPVKAAEISDPLKRDEILKLPADFHLQDAYYLPVGFNEESAFTGIDTTIAKTLLSDLGPLSIAYMAGDHAMKDNTPILNEETGAWYNPYTEMCNHQMLLVGWDDNYDRENFRPENRPEKNGAWLIRNSWGTRWGDDGYGWISYEDKTLSLSSAFLLEEKDNYQKNYTYDDFGWLCSVGEGIPTESGPYTTKGANVFTAGEKDEMLEAVSFYTTDCGADYTIEVYTDVKPTDTDPTAGGTLALTQEGSEAYAGYHTIELNHPVALKASEQFCVSVEFSNPEYTQPLAVEAFYDKENKQNYPEIAREGESYIYNPDDDEWYTTVFDFDVQYGPFPEDVVPFFLGNVCIKAFTNPLPDSGAAVPTVRFSEMAGPVANGTEIELTALGADKIRYSLDGSKPTELYTKPVTISFPPDKSVVLKACAEDENGNEGDVVSKTYTKAAAELSDWAIYTPTGDAHLDTTKKVQNLFFPNYVDAIRMMGQSCDSIQLDSTDIASGVKTKEIPLDLGEKTFKLNVRHTGGGKDSTEYIIHAVRSPLQIDYENETVTFDDRYTYYYGENFDRKLISGQSITDVIEVDNKVKLEYTEGEDTARHSDKLPGRASLPKEVPIDYENEVFWMKFNNPFRYSYNQDMTDAVAGNPGDSLPAVPGQTVYVQRLATKTKFVSPIRSYTAPDRPVADAQIESVTADTITLKSIEGALYKADDGEWQESPVFKDLAFAQEHTFSVFIPAGDDSYASEVATVCVGAVDPAKYSFSVKYEDIDGKTIGTKTVPFAAAGKFSREDIPVPEGYQQVLPAHPGDDWLYPTALSFEGGKWIVTEPTVCMTVEPLAKVTVTVQKADGTVLRTDTKYYAEGSFTETVKAPAGYHFDGGDQFTVKVSRDANGRLKADAPTFKFTAVPDKTAVESKPLTAVPDSLQKTSFNSVEKITDALKKAVMNQLPKDAEKGARRTVIFDVQLMITENGVPRPATAEELAGRGRIPVVLPYPEGTNAEGYRFAVAHMITTETGGYRPGDIETPEVTAMADGLHVTLQGLSPVMIAYSPMEKASPATGDGGHAAWWIGLSFASAAGAAYVIACSRKKEDVR